MNMWLLALHNNVPPEAKIKMHTKVCRWCGDTFVTPKTAGNTACYCPHKNCRGLKKAQDKREARARAAHGRR